MSWIDDLNLPYGTITGRAVAVYEDRSDEDQNPDVQPMQGRVRFSPSIRSGFIGSTFVQVQDVVADINAGELTNIETGEHELRLLSTDVELSGRSWEWGAVVEVYDGHTGRGGAYTKLFSRRFSLPSGAGLTLTQDVDVTLSHGGGGVYALTSDAVSVTITHEGNGSYFVKVG